MQLNSCTNCTPCLDELQLFSCAYAAIMDAPEVTRTIETDLPADELWGLVGAGAAWADCMVARSTVTIEPGGEGTVDDDGIERTVRIDEVTDGRVTFTWWPSDDAHRSSTVELVVVPARGGSTLHVTERFTARASMSMSMSSSTSMSAGIRWDVRGVVLSLIAIPASMSPLVVTA